MAILQDRVNDRSDYRERALRDVAEDREISLGTGTILSIFFALTLLCAVFFGFGYSMGRKSVATPTETAASPPAVSLSLPVGSKPAAGSPLAAPVLAGTVLARTQEPESRKTVTSDPPETDSEIVTKALTASNEATTGRRSSVRAPLPKPASDPGPGAAPASAAMPVVNQNGAAVVQVAAVSHQEDADTLTAALKKKGYAVFVRQEAQDHLLHVQIGPYGTHKEADLMRQHLLSDGYNAIVK